MSCMPINTNVGCHLFSFKLDMAIISFSFSLTRVAMLPIFVLLLCIPPPMALSLTFKKLPLPTGVNGPASSAFDSLGGGPYVGVQDGRILKYKEATACFVEFAFDAPTRLIWNIFHYLLYIYIQAPLQLLIIMFTYKLRQRFIYIYIYIYIRWSR